MYKKIVVTGNIIEVTTYDRLNVCSKGGRLEGDGEYTLKNYRQRQQTRRNRIRHLVACNFTNKDKFVTLTFRDTLDFDIRDVKACNKAFDRFVKRVRRRYPHFKYIAVIEFQDANGRGAVHYHMICNLPYVPADELAKLWGYGFIRINQIESCDNVGAYVVKYMNKDLDDTRLCGLKAYNMSQGLAQPVTAVSWERADDFLLQQLETLTQGKTPSYGATYESEHAGQVCFSQYNLNRQQG